MEPSSVDLQPTKNKKLLIIIITAAVVLVVAALAIFFANQQPNKSVKDVASDAAVKSFYDALGNAAGQQKLRVGMYRETFAGKADAEARKNVGTIASSVSEVDTAAGKFRSVFAHNLVDKDGKFSVGRCIDGTTYSDVYQPPAKNTQRAVSLQEAAGRMTLVPEGNLFQVTEALQFISCPHLGILPGQIAASRLSDGVIPVTLSDAQAANWTKKIQAADLFDIKDEGITERNGAKLHKFSFTPKNDNLFVNKKLYDIFYEAGEIEKIKNEHPQAEVEYEFQSINPLNTGSVGGYYLIDKTKNLPVYSELYGINSDKKTGSSPAARQNIARTKQTYGYPSQLTIGLVTPLEFME